MLDKTLYAGAVLSLVAFESYFCHPRKKSLYNMTRNQLTGRETTIPFRQKMWVKLPVAVSLSALVFSMVYPPHGYTVYEKVGLLSVAVTIRILLSGKVYIPMRMKPVTKRIMAFFSRSPKPVVAQVSSAIALVAVPPLHLEKIHGIQSPDKLC